MTDSYLEGRIRELEDQVKALKHENAFLRTYKTLAAGLAGERLISDAVQGYETPHVHPVDVITSDGLKIEVKYSKLSYPTKSNSSNPSRWQWGKVFGEKNSKDFDYLILVGEKDERYAQDYLDLSSPYVFFVLTRREAKDQSTRHTNGALGILLLTNPKSTGAKSSTFFSDYSTTIQSISERFGIFLPESELRLRATSIDNT